jgi:hypothetical protein
LADERSYAVLPVSDLDLTGRLDDSLEEKVKVCTWPNG